MDTDKTGTTRTYKCGVKPEYRTLLPSFLMVAGVIGVGYLFEAAWYWIAALCLPCLLIAVSVLWWPIIEPTNGILRERDLLFGRRVLAERITPLNEFVDIFIESVPGDVSEGRFRLGLRHKAGRKVWVAGVWAISRAVEEAAWQISCDTGIRLRGEPVSQ